MPKSTKKGPGNTRYRPSHQQPVGLHRGRRGFLHAWAAAKFLLLLFPPLLSPSYPKLSAGAGAVGHNIRQQNREPRRPRHGRRGPSRQRVHADILQVVLGREEVAQLSCHSVPEG